VAADWAFWGVLLFERVQIFCTTEKFRCPTSKSCQYWHFFDVAANYLFVGAQLVGISDKFGVVTDVGRVDVAANCSSWGVEKFLMRFRRCCGAGIANNLGFFKVEEN
jgi:hypothetical protein